MSQYVHIGRIAASFGVKGEMVLTHKLGKKTALKDVEAVFIEELKGSFIPYFLTASRAKDGTEIYIQVEGIDSKEATRRLLQKNVWLAENDFQRLVDAAAPLGLLGYTIFNEEEEIGVVEEVIEQPHQVLLRISFRGKEAYIPLHSETLDKIDRRRRAVHVTLPDGLLDVYS